MSALNWTGPYRLSRSTMVAAVVAGIALALPLAPHAAPLLVATAATTWPHERLHGLAARRAGMQVRYGWSWMGATCTPTGTIRARQRVVVALAPQVLTVALVLVAAATPAPLKAWALLGAWGNLAVSAVDFADALKAVRLSRTAEIRSGGPGPDGVYREVT